MDNSIQRNGSGNQGEEHPGNQRHRWTELEPLNARWIQPMGSQPNEIGQRQQLGREVSSRELDVAFGTNRESGLHNPGASARDMHAPTVEAYSELQDAYSYFNRGLFNRTLPECLITLQHQAGSYGFFRCQPFVNRDGERTDEISLNPKFFAARTDCGVLSTLVHEMAHLEQSHFGKPGRRGYHNREWANRMIRLGLYPSDTGEPGGAETGYMMTHYIVEGGPFDITCGRLLADGFHLSWAEAEAVDGNPPPTSPAATGAVDSSNRWKYTCPLRQQRLGQAADGADLWCLHGGHAAEWRRREPLMRGSMQFPRSQKRFCGSRLRSVPKYPLARGEACHDRMMGHAGCRSLGNGGNQARRCTGSTAGRGRARFIFPGTSRPCDGQSHTPNESTLPNQVFSDAGEVSFDREHRSLPPGCWIRKRCEAPGGWILFTGGQHVGHRSAHSEHRDVAAQCQPHLVVNEGRSASFYGIDERGCAGHPPCLSPSRRASDEAKQENVSGRDEQSIE